MTNDKRQRPADAKPTRDIFGNAVAWTPTGRRRVTSQGGLRAEMRKDAAVSWMFCRPAVGCFACAAPMDHDCKITETS